MIGSSGPKAFRHDSFEGKASYVYMPWLRLLPETSPATGLKWPGAHAPIAKSRGSSSVSRGSRIYIVCVYTVHILYVYT